jgi:hypothetical protein
MRSLSTFQIAPIELPVAIVIGQVFGRPDLRGFGILRFEKREPIRDRTQREILDDPRLVLANVRHAGAAAIRLGDERASALVEAERHRIR